MSDSYRDGADVVRIIQLGPYTFVQYRHHMSMNGSTLKEHHWRIEIQDGPPINMTFADLDMAMATAIAIRHQGLPGAYGITVGSAAVWFLRMIGALPMRSKASSARDTLEGVHPDQVTSIIDELHDQ